MGVAGVGKSSVLAEVARHLRWRTLEGDDVHPRENVLKMAGGAPLTDEDRAGWLDAIAAWIGERETAGESAVITCSALKRRYRDRLRADHPSILFAHLTAPRDVLEARIRSRRGHYMPPELLESQLEALEPLEPDEPGIEVDATPPPDRVATEIVERLALTSSG